MCVREFLYMYVCEVRGEEVEGGEGVGGDVGLGE